MIFVRAPMGIEVIVGPWVCLRRSLTDRDPEAQKSGLKNRRESKFQLSHVNEFIRVHSCNSSSSQYSVHPVNRLERLPHGC